MCDPVSAAIGAVGLIGSMAMAPSAPSPPPASQMPKPTEPTPPPAPKQAEQQAQRPTTPQEIRKANSRATPTTGPAATPADTWLTGPSGVNLSESNLKKASLLGN